MVNQNDLRTIKTERDIKQAFFTLLNKRGFEKITVNDIIKQALIGKGTFYNHYKDKYDLATHIVQEALGEYKLLLHQRLSIIHHTNLEKHAIYDLLPDIENTLEKFLLLQKINTPEINFNVEIKKIITQEYEILLKNSNLSELKEPQTVARLLATITLEYLSEYGQNLYQPNTKILNIQLQEFIAAIQYFYL
jgi:AcrR family transcriptional regulator